MTPDPAATPPLPHSHAFPLALAQPGERLRVVDLEGGQNLCRRMAEMGIVPGTEIHVEPGHHNGPRILIVKGTRLALGRGMTHRIRVMPVPKGIRE